MKPVYYDENTRTGWKLNPKDHEHRGWTYYKKGKARDEEGRRFSDESTFSGKWIGDKYKGAWNELLIKPTKKLITKHGGPALRLGIAATPGLNQFFHRGSLKLKPYRKNPIGTLHTASELLIDKTKNLIQDHTYEPGTSQGQSVYEAEQADLKIKKNKVDQLIKQAQNRKNQKVEK